MTLAGFGPRARAQIEAALGQPDKPTGRVQRTAHGPTLSRCATCSEIIIGETKAERHMKEHGHHRFEVIL